MGGRFEDLTRGFAGPGPRTAGQGGFGVRSPGSSRAPRWRPAGGRPAPGGATAAARGGVTAVAACCLALATSTPAGAQPFPPFLSHFDSVVNSTSTVPGDGDVNPYGIVNVEQTTGLLVRGDTLVSNFNNSSNLQGTGTTIVEMSPGPNSQQTLFAQINANNLPGACPGGVGLTTALTVLQGGFVVVGSLPTIDSGTVPEAGCLIVLNSFGKPVETWSGNNLNINGPWDLTALQFRGFAELFVTNVLNGLDGLNATLPANQSVVDQGTVVRLLVALPYGRDPLMLRSTVIGAGFDEQLNTSALVVGPTGDALGSNGTLYVADTVNSRIAEIPFAPVRINPVPGGGATLTSGDFLNGPLGMTLAPNGDIITVNAGNGDAVETSPGGSQIDNVQFDPMNAAGALFGLTIAPGNRGVLFVDDGDNTLKLFGNSGGGM
jgi:hypothetical protein